MNEYWKGKLNDGAITCYDLILSGLQKRIETIDCKGASQEDISDAYFAVYKDHPELFYMSNSPFISRRETKLVGLFSNSSVSTSVRATNIYDNRTIEKCRNEIDKIVKSLSKNQSEFDLVLQCLEYVVLNTEYKIDNQLNQNAAAALCYHMAQCSGISKAVKLLLDRMNVFCIIIEGQASGNSNQMEPHAWNIVQVNGVYYHIDATYMLGANMSKQIPLFRKFIFYDDATISKTHLWDTQSVPVCRDSSIYPTLNQKRNFTGYTRPASPNTVFNSLYELKVRLKKMVADNESRLEFRVNIQVTDNQELRRLLISSCDMAFGRDKGITYYINIADNKDVTLTVLRR